MARHDLPIVRRQVEIPAMRRIQIAFRHGNYEEVISIVDGVFAARKRDPVTPDTPLTDVLPGWLVSVLQNHHTEGKCMFVRDLLELTDKQIEETPQCGPVGGRRIADVLREYRRRRAPDD